MDALAEVDEGASGDRERRLGVQEDAVAAAADLGVVEDEVGHLRERERDHDEVDAARAQAERADDERVGGGRADRERQQQRERRAAVARGEHGGVGADAEEGRMAEADEAGGADDQLEAQREDGVDRDPHDEVLRVRRDRERQQRDDQRRAGGHEPAAGFAPADVGQRADIGLHRLARRSADCRRQKPRFISPSGRQTRITAIST